MRRQTSAILLSTCSFQIVVGVVLLAYATGAFFANTPSGISPIWPASGVCVVLLMRCRWKALVPMYVALVAASMLLSGFELKAALSMRVASVLEYALCAWLMLRFGRSPMRFREFSDIAVLVISGSLAACVGAGLGLLALSYFGEAEYSLFMLMLFLNGDALGIFLLVPLIVSFRESGQSDEPGVVQPEGWQRFTRSLEQLSSNQRLICLLLLSASLLVVWDSDLLAFGEYSEFAYLTFPAMLWLAVRLPMPWLVVAVFLMVLVACAGTAVGRGPFSHESDVEAIWELQTFLGVVVLSTLAIRGILDERDSAVRKLTRSDERFSALSKQTRDPFWCFRYEPPIPCSLPKEVQREQMLDGVLVEANEAYAGSVGARSVAEVLGKRSRDLIQTSRFASVCTVMDEFIEQGYSLQDMESQSRDANGNELWQQTSAQGILRGDELVENWGATRDITTRALHRLRFRRMIEHSFDGIVIYNAERIIVDASPSIEENYGWKLEDVLGRRDTTFLVEEMREHADQVWEEVIKTPGKMLRFQQRIYDAQGKKRWVEVVLTNLLHDAALRGVVCNFIDVTERKEAEALSASLEEQVQHAQKLESLGVLAGGIAHDFNNLLTAILGNTELALGRIDGDEKTLNNLNRVKDASKRAAILCQQMLAYSGRGSFVIEPVNLTQLVQEMVDLLRVSISKKAQLSFELQSDLPQINGDVAQLQQIVLNLLTNANEALDESGGRITVRTSLEVMERESFKHSFLDDELSSGEYVVLEVEDDGCGMDEETRNRLFDPFFTTKFQGRGLGMAAVIGIVRGHRGAIFVESESGKGSRFRVAFPKARDQIELVESYDESLLVPSDAGKKNMGTVLLVDDEEVVRSVGKELLESLNYEVVLAENGREALEIFKQIGDELRCVILDLTMPEMAGDECFVELQKVDPSVRVIIASGFASTELDKRFAEHHPFAFLSKPFLLDELAATLARALTSTGKIIRKRPAKPD